MVVSDAMAWADRLDGLVLPVWCDSEGLINGGGLAMME
tara:strand:+ start:388 stop:501 length:114 start_codon:yes stop_codon:yes gene_type:complete